MEAREPTGGVPAAELRDGGDGVLVAAADPAANAAELVVSPAADTWGGTLASDPATAARRRLAAERQMSPDQAAHARALYGQLADDVEARGGSAAPRLRRDARRLRRREVVGRTRAALRRPVVPMARPRERRPAGPRTRGRRSPRSSRAGPGDDDGESEPPGLRLRRLPGWGRCSPDLIRVLGGGE